MKTPSVAPLEHSLTVLDLCYLRRNQQTGPTTHLTLRAELARSRQLATPAAL